MPRTRTTTRKTGQTFTIEVSVTALNNELARRRKNKARKAKGEAKARPAAWYLPSLDSTDIAALIAGERVVKEFRSGNRARITAKS